MNAFELGRQLAKQSNLISDIFKPNNTAMPTPQKPVAAPPVAQKPTPPPSPKPPSAKPTFEAKAKEGLSQPKQSLNQAYKNINE